MIMRRRPLRGEKYVAYGEEVTVIEVPAEGKGNLVSVILKNGKISSVPKADLNLPEIDTKNYERVESAGRPRGA
jgi:hypothetical protein